MANKQLLKLTPEELLRSTAKDAGLTDEEIDLLPEAYSAPRIDESVSERIKQLEDQLRSLGANPEEIEEVVDPASDPYYDWSKVPSITHAAKSARYSSQKLHVEFKDASANKRFQIQWFYEFEIGRASQIGYQFIRLDTVNHGVATNTSKTIASASDKLRIPAARVSDTGEPLYMVCMFIPKKLLAQIENALQNEYRRNIMNQNEALVGNAKKAGFDTTKFNL